MSGVRDVHDALGHRVTDSEEIVRLRDMRERLREQMVKVDKLVSVFAGMYSSGSFAITILYVSTTCIYITLAETDFCLVMTRTCTHIDNRPLAAHSRQHATPRLAQNHSPYRRQEGHHQQDNCGETISPPLS